MPLEVSDQEFEELLLRLEELADESSFQTVADIAMRDEVLAKQIDRNPELLARLQNGLDSLRAADKRLHLEDEQPPPVVPGFTNLREIGRGGMGVVYRAEQPALRRTVALKLMLGGHLVGKNLRDRFRVEMESVAKLNHPNIVEVYEVGEANGNPYGCFEHLSGKSLAEAIAGQPLPERAAAQIVQSLALAVDYAHQQDIVHRDLKPSNVRATKEGIYKITDFGLAKDLAGNDELTRTGETPGSPSYMAPEQVHGTDVGPPADIYAIGAILYELLTGRPPFLGETSAETLLQSTSREPVAPRTLRTSLSRDLEAVCLKCLEKEPKRRYRTAAALADDLNRWLNGVETSARPAGPLPRLVKRCRRRPLVAGLSLVLACAFLALAAFGSWHVAQMQRARDREARARHIAVENEKTARESERRAIAEMTRSEQLLRIARIRRAHEDWKSNRTASFLAAYDELQDLGETARDASFPLRHIQRLAHLDEATIETGPAPLYAVAFLDDEKIITGTKSGEMCIWDRKTGRRERELGGHGSCVNSFDWSNDREVFASAGCDNFVTLWDPNTWQRTRQFRWERGAVGAVRFIDKNDEAASSIFLATYGLDQHLTAWTLSDQAKQGEDLIRQDPNVLWTMLSRDGEWLAMATRDALVRWWPRGDESQMKRYRFKTIVSAMAFSPNGDTLAAADTEGYVRLWPRSEPAPRPPFDATAGRVMKFSPDGTRIVVAGTDLVVRLWEVESQRLLRSFKVHDSLVNDISFSPAGDEILVAMDGGCARVWNINRATDYVRIPLEVSTAVDSAISSNARFLATTHIDGSIRVHDLASSESKTVRQPTKGFAPSGIRFSSDGETLIEHRARSGETYCWNSASVESKWNPRSTDRYVFDVHSESGQLIMAGSSERELVVSSIGKAQSRLALDVNARIAHAHFSPNADQVCVCAGKSVWLYRLDGSSAKVELALPEPYGDGACQFGKNGSVVAVAFGNQAALFDADDGSLIHHLRGHTRRIGAIAMSDDERYLATGSDDTTLRIWHLATGQEVLSLEGHRFPVLGASFTKGSTALYSVAAGVGSGAPDQRVQSVLSWPAP